MNKKPLGRKNYGSIPHLPNSRLGIGDHSCSDGQAKIATLYTRDKFDEVIVQEKLDGSNVGIARIDNWIYPLSRSGYLATTSPYKQHHLFADWVRNNADRFLSVLENGERLIGEWLALAHGTRYDLFHEPFVVFDIMIDDVRLCYDEFDKKVSNANFVKPFLIHRGDAFSVNSALDVLGKYGHHGAIDPVEGAVWRVERNRETGKKGERKKAVDFLVKYVRQDKEDGKYLQSVSGQEEIWNWTNGKSNTSKINNG